MLRGLSLLLQHLFHFFRFGLSLFAQLGDVGVDACIRIRLAAVWALFAVTRYLDVVLALPVAELKPRLLAPRMVTAALFAGVWVWLVSELADLLLLGRNQGGGIHVHVDYDYLPVWVDRTVIFGHNRCFAHLRNLALNSFNLRLVFFEFHFPSIRFLSRSLLVGLWSVYKLFLFLWDLGLGKRMFWETRKVRTFLTWRVHLFWFRFT